ncbi:MAG: hypothetical protein AABX47_05170 [Nanoarchaeota archaeon]
MTTFALKNVSEDAWLRFKSESARRGLKMGEFFERLLDEHSQSGRGSRAAWDRVLKGRPLLTDEDSKEMKKRMKDIRQEFEFRT